MNEVLSKNRALLIDNAIAAEDRKRMEDKFNDRIIQHRLRRGDQVLLVGYCRVSHNFLFF